MTEQVRAFVAKPGDLDSIPRTRVMERENQLSQVVFCPTHTMAHTCPIIIHALLVSFFFFNQEYALFYPVPKLAPPSDAF